MIRQIPFDFELVISRLDDKHRAVSIEPTDGDAVHILLEVESGRRHEVLQLGQLRRERCSLGHDLYAKWTVPKSSKIDERDSLRFCRKQLEYRLIGNNRL